SFPEERRAEQGEGYKSETGQDVEQEDDAHRRIRIYSDLHNQAHHDPRRTPNYDESKVMANKARKLPLPTTSVWHHGFNQIGHGSELNRGECSDKARSDRPRRSAIPPSCPSAWLRPL